MAEADEFAIPLAVILVIAAMFLSSRFMIHCVPVLFAELVVDGVLSASLFRRLRGLETRHWLETALRHTALPFAMTAVIVSASGWAMARHAPDAHSIGAFISFVNRDTWLDAAKSADALALTSLQCRRGRADVKTPG